MQLSEKKRKDIISKAIHIQDDILNLQTKKYKDMTTNDLSRFGTMQKELLMC